MITHERWIEAFSAIWGAVGGVMEMPEVVSAARAAIAEYRNEAIRCRKLAKHVLEDMDTNGVVIEFGMSPTFSTGFGMTICAPNLDESNLGEAAMAVVRDIFAAAGADQSKVMFHNPTVIGTEGDK